MIPIHTLIPIFTPLLKVAAKPISIHEGKWSALQLQMTAKQAERQEGLFIDNQIGLSCLVFPLGLENLHDDLLLLNEESSHDLLPHGFVAQHSAISPRH